MNEIFNLDCIVGMKELPDNFIDMTITSPPYDNLRDYNNSSTWNFDIFKQVADELYRITKKGGVVVWIVNDATINGSETGTSFKHALYFKEIGFNIHDTMIWRKTNFIPLTHNRYEQCFEYMFIFSKGRPKTFNPFMVETENAGRIMNMTTNKVNELDAKSSVRQRNELVETKDKKIDSNVWDFSTSRTDYNHPAILNVDIVKKHINSWSNKGDLILDPFMGSGTTAIACLDTFRKYIGFEIDESYYKVSVDRIKNHAVQLGFDLNLAQQTDEKSNQFATRSDILEM